MKTTEKKSKKGLVAAIGTLAVLLIAGAVVLYIFMSGEKEPEISVSGGMVSIKGVYGLDIPLHEVAGINLLESSMETIEPNGRRTNGYGGFGKALKGHFESEALGKYMLFVVSDSSPTIQISRAGAESVYISFGDPEKTRTLYAELSKAVTGW